MYGDSNVYAKLFYRVAKISGLAPFSFNNNRILYKSSRDYILPIFYTILFVCGFFSTIIDLRIDGVFISSSIKCVGIPICMIIFLCNSGIIIQTVDTFFEIDDIFKLIDIVYDYKKDFRIRGKIFSVWLTVSMTVEITMLVSYIIANEQTDLVDIWSYILLGNLGSFINYNVTATFVIVMVFAIGRLRSLNESLLHIRDSAQQEARVSDRNNPVVRRGLSDTPNVKSELLMKIEIIGKAYDLLCDAIDNTMRLFSFPLLIIITDYFVRILFTIYGLSKLIISTLDKINLVMNLFLLMTVIMIVLIMFDLFAVAFVSTRVQILTSSIPASLHTINSEYNQVEITDEASSISDELHNVLMEYQSAELQDELQMLSLQLLQRPVKIAAFGFFALDYSYLYKFSCAVVAYFVVMVQLDSSKGKDVQRLLNQTGLNVTDE